MNRSYPFKLPQLLLLTNLVVINHPNANIADYIPENVRAFGKGCSNKLSKLKTSTSNYVSKKVQESPRLQRARNYVNKQGEQISENVVKPITRRFTWPNIHSNKDNPQQKQDVDNLQRKSFGDLHQDFAPPKVEVPVTSSTPDSPSPESIQRRDGPLSAAELLAKSLAGDYENHQKSDSSDSEFEDEVARVTLPPIQLRPSNIDPLALGIMQVTQEPRVSPKLSREDSSQISEKRLAREALAQASNSQVPLIPLPTSPNNGAPLADKKATLEASGSVIIHEDPPVSRSHKQSKSTTELPDMPSLNFAQKKTLTRSASLNLSDLENDMKELEGLSQNLRTEIAGIDKKLEPPAVGTQSLPNSPLGNPENILVPPNSPLTEVRPTNRESASRPGLNMEALKKALRENKPGLRTATPPPSKRRPSIESPVIERKDLSTSLPKGMATVDQQAETPKTDAQSLAVSPLEKPKDITALSGLPMNSRPGLNMEALQKAIAENQQRLQDKNSDQAKSHNDQNVQEKSLGMNIYRRLQSVGIAKTANAYRNNNDAKDSDAANPRVSFDGDKDGSRPSTPTQRRRNSIDHINEMLRSVTRIARKDQISMDNNSQRGAPTVVAQNDGMESVIDNPNSYKGSFKNIVDRASPQSTVILLKHQELDDKLLKDHIEEVTKDAQSNPILSRDNLQLIDISDNSVTAAIIPLLDEKLPKLTHLDLSNTNVRLAPDVLPTKILTNSTNIKPYFNDLKELYLDNLNMQDVNLLYTAKILGNNIATLSLAHNNIRDVSILPQYKPNISRLCLSHNKLDILNVNLLLTKMSQLKHLDISHNNLGAQLLESLTSMDISTIKLRSLDISNNGLTDEQENNIKILFANHGIKLITTKDRLASNS